MSVRTWSKRMRVRARAAVRRMRRTRLGRLDWTKNDEPRGIPLTTDLLAVLRTQKKLRDRESPQCRLVFFRDVEQILDFRGRFGGVLQKRGDGRFRRQANEALP